MSIDGRKTHCPRGHLYAGDNLIASELRNGRRKCRLCHNARQRVAVRMPRGGSAHPAWNGGRTTNGHYTRIHSPGHPRAVGNNYVYEHVLVAERVLGKLLPAGAVIHHHDGDKHNNTPSNLVICQDQAYHSLLHQRARAFDATGHTDWLRCPICKTYDEPSNLYVRPGSGKGHHRECHNRVQRKRRNRRG